ncbi:MAG: hypothetical protein ACREQR_15115 [Candidatus Binataceae bacterium]
MAEQHTPTVGEIAPGFALPDSDGQVRELTELAASGLCAIVFYRGHW